MAVPDKYVPATVFAAMLFAMVGGVLAALITLQVQDQKDEQMLAERIARLEVLMEGCK